MFATTTATSVFAPREMMNDPATGHVSMLALMMGFMARDYAMSRLGDLAHKIRVDAHAVWLTARDPAVPPLVRLFGLALAAYALSPIDLIPDFIPILGLIDDAIILPLGLWLFLKMVPEGVFAKHRAEAEDASHRPRSLAGALFIVALWLVGALWIAVLLIGVGYY